MIDCIASYHLNPHGCGVAKFNYRLAQELRVPVVPLGEPRANALVSVKWEELPLVCQGKESEWFTLVQPYDLFLHGDRPSDDVMNHARRIFHGSADVVIRLDQRHQRAWCPSTVPVTDLRPMTRVLTFGMAHKLATRSYERLRDLLTAAHGTEYVVGVSVAIHDGTNWQEDMQTVQERLTGIFGDKAHLFGAMADAGVSATLQGSTAMAAFFEDGVRANNTTVWAALEHGIPVITNLDRWSPPDFVHGVNIFDIGQMVTWPSRAELRCVGAAGQALTEQYSW